ncbi:MAG: ribosome silencing factor [Rickettsiales bacterium]
MSPADERRNVILTKSLFPKVSLAHLERLIVSLLDNHKAENIISVDLVGKSDFADRMIIADGTSNRHVGSLADNLVTALKQAGFDSVPVEGKETCDWVLVDAGDIIVHLFKPEMREHYNLEKMWSVEAPEPQLEAAY